MTGPFTIADLLRILLATTAFAVWLAGLWVLTGVVRSHGFGREGDVRKINHITAFTGGALAMSWLPEATARVCLYVVSAQLLLLVAVACRFRDRPPFCHIFAANTRRSDAPHEAYFFWSSWLLSLLALVAIDLAFHSMAVTRTAALIVGIADGIAEPIGRRYGRHRYRVPTRHAPPTYRSAEGSAAVLVATLAVMLVCTSPASGGAFGWVLAATGTALAVTATEALSPRGTDNLTVPLVAAGLIRGFLGAAWIG